MKNRCIAWACFRNVMLDYKPAADDGFVISNCKIYPEPAWVINKSVKLNQPSADDMVVVPPRTASG